MKVLKFSATWCGPCKQLALTMSDMELPLEVVSYDVDVNLDETVKYNVRGVPTMIIVTDDGDEVKRTTGALSKQKLLEFMEV